VVKELLSKGASPNGVDRENFTKIPLLLATERRNTYMVKMLLDSGAYKEARENLGLTALFLAVGNQDLPMIDVLIYRGANVNA
jgi:ankyrin repeat protein